MAKPLEDWMIPLIKGMLTRGDDQSDVAACFLINGGRVADINRYMTRAYEDDEPAPTTRARPIIAETEGLPSPPPYPSPYELWKAKSGLWAARVALEAAQEKIALALLAVEKAESRTSSK